ncbi:hypothetical protein AK812_SmicGene37333 [Symbiodinium microadriaticum]|uniref:Uncharacterized protein n=1 Tax=Symbiodinium microadriaticum TaxID=2951 RepID=A0A1Q9CGS8_SYMMI|nr:hypothetical protein AK812_SmicGene37333 [Symbiodinium microadriaticum]
MGRQRERIEQPQSCARLCQASAYVRVAKIVHGKELLERTFQEEVEQQQSLDLHDRRESDERFGELQLIGGEALGMSTEINLNELYGKPDDLKKQFEVESGCHVVKKHEMKKNGDRNCQYVMVFENKDAPINELAANCVPSAICKENVVGMTQGKIASYGVVLQILQRNLGTLVYIGEGKPDDCYKRMNEVNKGDLSKIFKMHTIEFLGMHFTEKKMEIDGMTKLAAEESLADCADKESGEKNAYLYIHKNLLWDNDKEDVSIQKYTDRKEEKLMAKAAKELFADAEKKLGKPPGKERHLSEVVV